MNKPHKHADLIKAWADGAEIQCSSLGKMWHDTPQPSWENEFKYRIKPPASKWPETTMPIDQLVALWAASFESNDGVKLALSKVANAAIAHALETGQVVLPSKEAKTIVWTGGTL